METMNNIVAIEKTTKSPPAVLRAMYKYQKHLKNKNREQYKKRLLYYRQYYANNKNKLKEALEQLSKYEKQISSLSLDSNN